MQSKVLGIVLLYGSLLSVARTQQNASLQSWEVPFSLAQQFHDRSSGFDRDLGQLNFLIDTGHEPERDR